MDDTNKIEPLPDYQGPFSPIGIEKLQRALEHIPHTDLSHHDLVYLAKEIPTFLDVVRPKSVSASFWYCYIRFGGGASGVALLVASRKDAPRDFSVYKKGPCNEVEIEYLIDQVCRRARRL